MQKINKHEIRSVLNLAPQKRYLYFIKRVVDFNAVWLLFDKDGKWAEAFMDEYKLVSLWSAKEYADLLIEGPWAGCSSKSLSLEDFYYTLIENFGEDLFLINVFSKPGKAGFVVDLEEFKRDISKELEKYSI